MVNFIFQLSNVALSWACLLAVLQEAIKCSGNRRKILFLCVACYLAVLLTGSVLVWDALIKG